MNEMLALIGRDTPLFAQTMAEEEERLSQIIRQSSFLVIGGAGSIGQAVTRALFLRRPRLLHVVDLSENRLVELVRDLRSTNSFGGGEFRTLALDAASPEFAAFFSSSPRYDYLLNLAALKHVRSERDPWTLMRMLRVNILDPERSLQLAIRSGASRYFSVSTDKAARPVSLMGASKRLMEDVLALHSQKISVGSARFANVAFSAGSLLYGFRLRLEKLQPIAVPRGIRRYFFTAEEAGELCLFSCLLGENRQIFFPRLNEDRHLCLLTDVAERFLASRGLKARICDSEEEARDMARRGPDPGYWPCLFSSADTSGEKEYEVFVDPGERQQDSRFPGIGIIHQEIPPDERLADLRQELNDLLNKGHWTKRELVRLVEKALPGFAHQETGKDLDGRM